MFSGGFEAYEDPPAGSGLEPVTTCSGLEPVTTYSGLQPVANVQRRAQEQLRQRLAGALPVWLVSESHWRPGSYRLRVAESDKPGLHRMTSTMLQALDEIMVSARLSQVELIRRHPSQAATHRLHETIAGLAVLKLPPSWPASSLSVHGRCVTERTLFKLRVVYTVKLRKFFQVNMCVSIKHMYITGFEARACQAMWANRSDLALYEVQQTLWFEAAWR